MRKIWLGRLGLLAIVVACGETSKHPPQMTPEGDGGEAGTSPTGAAGTSVMTPETSGGAAGGDGDVSEVGGAAHEEPTAGAGGEPPEPLPGYSLTFIPDFDPPPGSIPPPERGFAAGPELGISRDGSRLFTTSGATYANETRAEMLTWSEATGSVFVPLPKSNTTTPMPNRVCVADDGSAAFFTRTQYKKFDAYHWTAAEGLGALPAISGLGVSDASCNAAATRAAFVVDTSINGDTGELRLWQAGENNDGAKLVSWPLADQKTGSVIVSQEAERGILDVRADKPTSAAYAWSPPNDALKLGTGDFCQATLISADGNVIAGACDGGGFRWSSQAGLVSLDGFSPYFMSRDGQTLWGIGASPGRPALRVLLPGADEPKDIALPKDPDRFELFAASDDGKIAYLNLNTIDTDATRAARVSSDGKLDVLELPAAQTHSTITAISTDGSVAVGWTRTDDPAVQRAVLWDSQGARDVLEALKDAHVDVSGISDMRLTHVWSGEKLRLHGTCDLKDQLSLLFFAELPVR